MDYRKGDYFYRNISFIGKNNFIGQEIIYQLNRPVWGMVYFGVKVIDDEVFDFLKRALLKLCGECRFGLQCSFKEDSFLYEDKGQGVIEKFEGEERVFEKKKEVYQLKYLGGLILK